MDKFMDYTGLNNESQNVLIDPPGIFSLDFSGRYGRLNYVRASCLMTLALGLAGVVSFLLGPVGMLLAFLFIIFAIILEIRIYILRVHDLGWSGWLVLLLFIPLANIVMMFIMLFIPGTKGANRFGSQTKPSSALYIILLIVIVLFSGYTSAITFNAMEQIDYINGYDRI